MQTALARFVMSQGNVEPKRSVAKYVEERCSAGICLIKDCDCKSTTRGLCQKHFSAFYNRLRSILDEALRIVFENEAIRDGLILPAQKIRDYNRTGPFANVGKDK